MTWRATAPKGDTLILDFEVPRIELTLHATSDRSDSGEQGDVVSRAIHVLPSATPRPNEIKDGTSN